MSADGLARVRDHVVASSELTDRLSTLTAADVLHAAFIDVGRSIGAEVTRADIADALGASGRHRAERHSAVPDLRGWVPHAVELQTEDPELRWCHLGGARLTSPFFDQDVEAARSRPFNALFEVRTSMVATAAHLAAHPPIAPTAFIFHTGRCGSTLVAQLLAADPANRVVSEPPPLDVVLRAPSRRVVDEALHVDWIRTTVGALGQAEPGEQRLFVKVDSWSVLDAERLDAAFPDVPWLFLARDPLEVLVSQLRQPPMTLLTSVVPAEVFGIGTAEAVTWSRARYGAHIQATLLAQMARHVDRAFVVEHRELPGAIEPWLAGLGVPVDDATRLAIRERATRHGKHGVIYADDQREKRAAATVEVRTEVASAAGPAFIALLAARAAPT